MARYVPQIARYLRDVDSSAPGLVDKLYLVGIDRLG
jgi:hypothetical protein